MQYQADSSFDADLFAFLEHWEGVVYTPYNDVGNIAIGIGYNLTTGDPALRTGVLTQTGLNVSANPNSSNPAEQAEADFVRRLNADLDTGYSVSILQDLDAIMAERALKAANDSAFAAYIGTSTPRNSFSFTHGTTTQNQTGLNEMQAVFSLAIPHYQNIVFDKLGITQQTAPAGFVGSKEEEALLSLAWNGAILITPGLVNAVKSGNRAEAWFEIRYVSNYVGRDYSLGHALTSKEQNLWNSNFDKGWAARRYAEADLFSLYDDTAHVTATEATNVYRMFTKHRSEIAAYEQLYGLSLDGNPGLRADMLGNSDSIFKALAPAMAAIMTDLSIGTEAYKNADIANAFAAWLAAGNDQTNFDSTKIFVGFDGSVAVDARQYNMPGIMGAEVASNDIVIAGDGGMVTQGYMLMGGSGNDVLYGGPGNDILAGGAGNDIYILDGGGHDTIEDKQGTNTVILNGKTLFGFYTSDGTNFLSLDGAFTGTLQNGDFIVTDITTGDQVTLNKNFQDGDFGIKLVKNTILPAPVPPVTPDHIITGQDQASGGPVNDILYGYGNGANDLINAGDGDNYVSAQQDGNDTIISGSGDDSIFCSDGNNNINAGDGTNVIFSGKGNSTIRGGINADLISAGDGNNVIIGGGGATITADNSFHDALHAGNGNNQIYADTQVDLATALANQKTAQATHQQGTLLAAGDGNNTLVGGNGKKGTGSGLTFDTHPATLYDRRISRHLRREPWPDRSGLNLLMRFITLCITEVLHCNIPALSNSRFCQNTADILFCPQPLNALLD